METPTVDAFQVIADPSRRRMLDLLSHDTLTINALAQHFNISRPAVSKHVRILESGGFISIHDIGRERHCVLKKDGFDQIRDWASHFDRFWSTKLRRLENLLRNQTR